MHPKDIAAELGVHEETLRRRFRELQKARLDDFFVSRCKWMFGIGDFAKSLIASQIASQANVLFQNPLKMVGVERFELPTHCSQINIYNLL